MAMEERGYTAGPYMAPEFRHVDKHCFEFLLPFSTTRQEELQSSVDSFKMILLL